MSDPRLAELDVLVLGSGVAGLSAVVRLAEIPGYRVGVLSKAELTQSATRWAQGGVAAVTGGDEDSTDLHLADTLAAGAGLCDPTAARLLVDEGPARVGELIALGAVFDREAGGSLALAREGGHSKARVLHAGGAATGAEVERALVAAVRQTATAVLEGWFAVDLVVEDAHCAGVTALDVAGRQVQIRAKHVVLATGGAGQLYSVTTNPPEATGDGIAMALRAGVPVADIEFFQFHPTALHHPAMPRPLMSEALRGHGALIRDADGTRFVDELAPRDLVSRAMAERMAEQGVDHMWLDATSLESFDERFPTLSASLRAAGLDPAVDWLPVAPAAHHLSGGILTDLDGASALPGLWAAGEVACTGVHGANRLASNSLLEGMVFGARLSEAIEAGKYGPGETGALVGVLDGSAQIACRDIEDLEARPLPELPASCAGESRGESRQPAQWLDYLQKAMTEGAGVLRSESSLDHAANAVAATSAVVAEATADHGIAAEGSEPADRLQDLRRWGELANLVDVAGVLLRSARVRKETRGAHGRREYPQTDSRWRVRIVHRCPVGHLGDRIGEAEHLAPAQPPAEVDTEGDRPAVAAAFVDRSVTSASQASNGGLVLPAGLRCEPVPAGEPVPAPMKR